MGLPNRACLQSHVDASHFCEKWWDVWSQPSMMKCSSPVAIGRVWTIKNESAERNYKQKCMLLFSWRAHPPVCRRLWLKLNGHFALALAKKKNISSKFACHYVNQTYTAPWSVEGGARKSGFSLSMPSSVGPRSVAPREPRMGCGLPWKFESQSGSLGSRLIGGTVAVGGAIELAGVAPTSIAGAE